MNTFKFTASIPLICLSVFAQGQNFFLHEAGQAIKGNRNTSINKSAGDTLYYEDFSSGSSNSLPNGWTNLNPNNNGYDWIWSDTSPGGQYSTNISALNSTSAGNGFISLPSDLYNTPAIMFVVVDATLKSGPIPIQPKNTVLLSFETANRYCCGTNAELVVEVSADGQSWSPPFDATMGNAPNDQIANATKITFNVSSYLGNQDTVYIRFRQENASHYYWMIDDLMLTEGYDNAMRVLDFKLNYTDTFMVNPVLSSIPHHMIEDLSFSGEVEVSGNYPQTNTYSSLRIFQDSLLNGQAGSGLVFQDSLFISSLAASLQRDSFFMGTYPLNLSPAYYRAELRILSDSVNETPLEGTKNFYFVVSDTVMDKGNGEIRGLMSTRSYGSPQNQNGKALVTSFAIEDKDSVQLKSISIFSILNPGVDSIGIKPIIWQINQSDSSFSFVTDNPNPNYILQSMNNQWINLNFGNNPVWLKNGKLYAIGYQQISSTSQYDYLSCGRYFEMESIQPDFSTFIGFPTDSSWQNFNWAWTSSLPAIRLNFETASVGINEQTVLKPALNFEIFPNPNQGYFTLKYKFDISQTVKITIFNTLGEAVYSENFWANKTGTKKVKLQEISNGLYYLSLKTDDSRMVKKVLLQR